MQGKSGSNAFWFSGRYRDKRGFFCVQGLLQNCKDVNRDVFLAFIDYEKAFESVRHDKLVEILQTTGIDVKWTSDVTKASTGIRQLGFTLEV